MEIHDVEAFLEYYSSVRRRTRAVASCVPEDRLEWSPGEGRFSSGDLLRHVAATERWMWAENVQGRPSRYPGHGPELAAGKDGVLAYLDEMQDETARIVAGLDADQLERKVSTVGGIEMRAWKWLRLMIEHEIHHRGQLYGLLGHLNVETPPLYGLTEREVHARSRPAE